jgi:hypothetical protein
MDQSQRTLDKIDRVLQKDAVLLIHFSDALEDGREIGTKNPKLPGKGLLKTLLQCREGQPIRREIQPLGKLFQDRLPRLLENPDLEDQILLFLIDLYELLDGTIDHDPPLSLKKSKEGLAETELPIQKVGQIAQHQS